jgi:hypothetical protein
MLFYNDVSVCCLRSCTLGESSALILYRHHCKALYSLAIMLDTCIIFVAMCRFAVFAKEGPAISYGCMIMYSCIANDIGIY